MENFNNYFNILKTVPIFDSISGAEMGSMLNCLGARIKSLPKNGAFLLAGEKPVYIGIVLTGQLHIVREDYEGNRIMIASAAPGGIFAEALCCADIEESPVSVLAAEDSSVMLLRFENILRVCPSACPFHRKLLENMLRLVSNKNLYLQGRMEIVSIKSVRWKVLRYLESFAQKRGREIVIPFNREELAGYLCVERSALSHELMKMKRDGLIDYRKNAFILK